MLSAAEGTEAVRKMPEVGQCTHNISQVGCFAHCEGRPKDLDAMTPSGVPSLVVVVDGHPDRVKLGYCIPALWLQSGFITACSIDELATLLVNDK